MRHESGNDFPVELAARRPGDAAEIVASAERTRNLLGWRPQWEDLSLIVRYAFAWERSLQSTAGPAPSHCPQGETRQIGVCVEVQHSSKNRAGDASQIRKPLSAIRQLHRARAGWPHPSILS
jgi:UDP-glucose 4-epimerase